ncbi:MAG: FAD-dependent oxidoreductase [Myxococcales bacterium]|nr:FAD-dependent oxidoreductase [Myxococcota bacterium]MDW8280240.1 FAD-dependent oxidoreductase [Myxococcales bacterium]
MLNTLPEPDVIVVGAGFAGLAAADRLSAAGCRVVVLEAQQRVGGRVATVHLPDGTPVDLGGQWLGPQHARLHALAARLGAQVYPTPTDGHNLLYLGGQRHLFRGTVPLRLRPLTLGNLGWVLLRLHQLSQRVPLETPWEAAQAAAWDGCTLGAWLRRNAPDAGAFTLSRIALEAIFAAHPDELSLLHALFYLRAGGGLLHLVATGGGAQQDRIVGGMQTLAERLAQEVERRGSSVRLGTPVRQVRTEGDRVVVEGEAGAVRGGRAIIALPPSMAGELSWHPALPQDHAELLRRVPMGSVIKWAAAYEVPFWRARGLSGQAISDEGPVHMTFDASPPAGKPGLLVGFVEGPAARRLASWDPAQRRQEVLRCLVRLFGDQAGSPQQYVERVWSAEPWSRGGYAGLFPPGVWTQLGQALRRPEGLLHFAGTETATVWNGYIEGALQSGERAAEEVLTCRL